MQRHAGAVGAGGAPRRPLLTSARHGALALVALALVACTETRPRVVVFTRGGGEIPVLVEVADNAQSRNRGLMYRTELAEDHGMLFLFEKEEKHVFWMKNTPRPLDMIFLSPDGRVVGIHENAEPFSLEPVDVSAPSKAVLEVNGGFAARHQIAIGDRVDYRNLVSALLP